MFGYSKEIGMSNETRNNAADIDSGKKWLALINGKKKNVN